MLDSEKLEGTKSHSATETPPVPAYWRIENDLRTRILSGIWSEGTMLPSRKNLAREYGVALRTMERAIAGLLTDGTLRADEGRGTFVAHPVSLKSTTPLAGSNFRSSEPLLNGSRLDRDTVNDSERTSSSPLATMGIVTMLPHDPTGEDGTTFWTRLIIRSLEGVCTKAGLATRMVSELDARQDVVGKITTLIDQGVDALAIVGIYSITNDDALLSVAGIHNIPVVYISWQETRLPLPHVFYDQQDAGYQAARHLLQSGYDRLMFLRPFKADWVEKRIQGTREALRHAGLPADRLMVYPPECSLTEFDEERTVAGYTVLMDAVRNGLLFYTDEEKLVHPSQNDSSGVNGHEAIREARASRVWGLIAPNDATALEALRAASELGKVSGTDFGLIGFDDDTHAVTSGLSTMRPPLEELGEEAGRMLISALEGKRASLQVRLRSHLFARRSTSRGTTLRRE